MLCHLVCLLEAVVNLACHSGPLQDALRPDDWKCLTILDVALRKLCEEKGWY